MKTNSLRLLLTVFLCGAVVMIYEITGSRVVAPYIGSSLYTWTSLIGIILAALSAGYSVGGRLADKNPSINFLATVIFGAGGLISLTTLIKDPFLEFITGSGLGIELLAAISSLFLFAPAAFFLGFVSPYAARLSISNVENSGRTVGNIYTVSTIGSIVGTFLAGFVLLPFLGTNRTLYLVSILTFAASLLLLPEIVSRIKTASVVVFVLGVVFMEVQAALLFRQARLFDIDTGYNRVRVFDVRKDSRPARILTTDPFSIQSSIYLDSGKSAANYTEFFEVAFELKPDIARVLVIGGAAMSYPKDLLTKRPNLEIDVVEIDSGMTSIAREHFGLGEKPGFEIIHQDGRRFLNNAASNSYDLVVLDAFNSMLYVPFHLTTVEAMSEIKRVLRNDGLYVANLSGAVEGPAALFSRSSKKTTAEVFAHFRSFQVLKDKKPDKMQSLIYVASEKKIKFKGGNSEGYAPNEVEIKSQEGILLTDDFAPVERFMSIAFSEKTD